MFISPAFHQNICRSRLNRLVMGAFWVLIWGLWGCEQGEKSSNNPPEPPVVAQQETEKPAPVTHCGLIRIKENKKYGFIDCEGKIVVEPRYDYAEPFEQEMQMGKVYFGEKMGVIDEKGKVLIPPNQIFLEILGENVVAVVDTAKRGFYLYDRTGKLIISRPFNPVFPVEEGIVMARWADELWVMNEQGERLFMVPQGMPLRKERPGIVSEGMIGIVVDNKVGFYTQSGQMVAATKYDNAEPFSEEMALIVLNGKVGFIDKSGKEVVAPQYQDAHSFSGGVTAVLESESAENPGWKIIDKAGNEVSPNRFAYLAPFQFGVSWAKRPPAYGLISAKGFGVSLPGYDAIGYAESEPPFITEKEGKVGAIGPDGGEWVPFEFDFIDVFREGVAPARKGETTGLITQKGTWVLEIKENGQFLYENGLYVFIQQGYLNPPEFEQEQPLKATYYTPAGTPVLELPAK